MIETSSLVAITAAVASVGVWLDAAELLGPRSPLDRYFPWALVTGGSGASAHLVRKPTLRWLLRLQTAAALATPPLLLVEPPWGGMTALAVLGVRLLVLRRTPFSAESSDSMQLVVWASVAVFGVSAPGLGQQAALWFLAAQGVTAYVTAGVKKLGVRMWRDGTAISAVLRTETYGAPVWAPLARRRRLTAALSVLTLAFEIVGPLLLFLGPPGAAAFAVIAFGFHLGVAATMGVDRFVFAFGAVHPALFWASTHLHEAAASALSIR